MLCLLTTVDIRIAIIEINIARWIGLTNAAAAAAVVVGDAVVAAAAAAAAAVVIVIRAIVAARGGHQRSVRIKHVLGLGGLIVFGVFGLIVGGLRLHLQGLQDNHGLVLLAAGVRGVRLVSGIANRIQLGVVWGCSTGVVGLKIQTRFSFLAGL